MNYESRFSFTDCYDAIETCKELKADGKCNSRGPEWQRKNCKKTCNMCGKILNLKTVLRDYNSFSLLRHCMTE